MSRSGSLVAISSYACPRYFRRQRAAQHRFGAAATNQYGRSKKKSNFRRQPQQPQKLMLMTDKSGLRHPFTMWFRSATARTLKAHMQVAPPLRSRRMTDSTLSVLPRIEIHWKIPSVAGANDPAYAQRSDRFADLPSEVETAKQHRAHISSRRHLHGDVPLSYALCVSRADVSCFVPASIPEKLYY